MKILSPFDKFEEVGPLIDSGADELYGGLVPDGWRDGSVAANRRSFAQAQVASEAEFAEATRAAEKRGIPVHLTLNAPFYHHTLYPELMAFCARALDWGVDTIITSDLGLMMRLKAARSDVGLTLSTMAGAMNRESVAFHKRFGIRRAVLPRHLTLAEMKSVVASEPGIEFEAFVLIGKCPNEEAYCTFQHVSPSKRWPCEIPYRRYEGAGTNLADRAIPQVASQLRWETADRRMGCGLCAAGRLEEMGVGVLKLVGRGGPTEGKLANVKLARKYADSGEVELDARADYAARFGRRCVKEVCYFPELFRSK